MSEFQKDLYEKKGSLFTAWDFCVGAGFISLIAGVYLNHKDKKALKRSPMMLGSGIGALSGKSERSSSMPGFPDKSRGIAAGASGGSDIGASRMSPRNKPIPKGSKNTEDMLQKLGL